MGYINERKLEKRGVNFYPGGRKNSEKTEIKIVRGSNNGNGGSGIALKPRPICPNFL